MDSFELVTLKNGVVSLRSKEGKEIFHPGIGPVEEATILYVKQQRLLERVLQLNDFHLWDVGLGAGANALAAIETLKFGIPSDSQNHQITIQSFDKTTAPLEFALKNAQSLKYPLAYETEIKTLLSDGIVKINDHIIWRLNLGDFSQLITKYNLRAPDSIFYDPYSPVGNPEMWNLNTFRHLRSVLDDERPCLLTNYTRSTSVRVTLLMAGFYVGVGTSVDKKEETTIASNFLSEIEKPLDMAWLEKRVSVSHNAAPQRSTVYQISPIFKEDFEFLKQLPQFQIKSLS